MEKIFEGIDGDETTAIRIASVYEEPIGYYIECEAARKNHIVLYTLSHWMSEHAIIAFIDSDDLDPFLNGEICIRSRDNAIVAADSSEDFATLYTVDDFHSPAIKYGTRFHIWVAIGD